MFSVYTVRNNRDIAFNFTNQSREKRININAYKSIIKFIT